MENRHKVVDGVHAIDLAGNWVSFHGGLAFRGFIVEDGALARMSVSFLCAVGVRHKKELCVFSARASF